jgi:SprT protein
MTTHHELSADLLHAVQYRLNSCLAKAREHCKIAFPMPNICYRLRGTRAGTAHLLHWEIRLNPVLLQENQTNFIDQVVPHELAHLLVFRQFGAVKPHGKEWQWMMSSVLGVPAQRTHTFDTQSVFGRWVEYHCQCQTHQLSIRRHNKVQRRQSQYFCRRCQQPLKITTVIGKTS